VLADEAEGGMLVAGEIHGNIIKVDLQKLATSLNRISTKMTL